MKHNMKVKIYFVFPLLILFLFAGCFSLSYSSKGGSLDPQLKTASVQFFTNRATRINPLLSQKFTDALKLFLLSNTKLRIVNTRGDVDFSGEIKNYRIRSEAIAAGDLAAQTRFTITIRVKYTNYNNSEDDFDTNFEGFRIFESTTDFTSVEEELTVEIINEILDKIYNKAFVNW